MTYALVHGDGRHLTDNLVIHFFVGLPLEIVYGHFRIAIIYATGVVGGNLISTFCISFYILLILLAFTGMAIHTYFYSSSALGSSAACCALVTAYLSTIIRIPREIRGFRQRGNFFLLLNWIVRLGAFCFMIGTLLHDVSMRSNYLTSGNSTQLSSSAEGVLPPRTRPPPSPWAHIGGAIAGFLVGLAELHVTNSVALSKIRRRLILILMLAVVIIFINIQG